MATRGKRNNLGLKKTPSETKRKVFEKEEVTNVLVPATQLVEEEDNMETTAGEVAGEEEVCLYVPVICDCSYCMEWNATAVLSGWINNNERKVGLNM